MKSSLTAKAKKEKRRPKSHHGRDGAEGRCYHIQEAFGPNSLPLALR